MAEAPDELMADPAVPWSAKACASVLWRLVRRDDPAPRWWESFSKLAKRLGCTPRQAKRAHDMLVAAGWATRGTADGPVERWETVLHFEAHPPTTQRPPLLRSEAPSFDETPPENGPPPPAEQQGDPPESGLTPTATRSAIAPSSPDHPQESPDDCTSEAISLAANGTAVAVTGDVPQLALVRVDPDPPAESELTLEHRRRKAAKRVWELHERLCVEAGIGMPAEGGGLREPTAEDLSAIRRCAKAIGKQERVPEERAWQILAEATRAVVGEAVAARARGDERSKKLCGWRRSKPFGGPRGTKLTPMLIAREAVLRRGGPVVNGHRMTPEQARAWAQRNGGTLPDGFAYDASNNVVREEEAAADG